MKRFWTVAIAAGCVLFALAGCSRSEESTAATGGESSSAGGVTELTVWCWDPAFNIYAMNTAAEIYQADHPNVTVNVVETPWNDLQQKLITSLTANDTSALPDIILCQDNALQKNIASYPDAFLPLEDRIDLSQFAQFKADFGEYNGHHYSVPFDNGVTATFLRKDIIEQAGLSVSDFDNITWKRFIELGKTVREKTGTPLITYSAQDLDCLLIMLQSAGTWLFDDDGNPYMKDNPVLKEALSLYAEMSQEGVCVTVPDWNAFIATIQNGSVASVIDGCWIIGSIKGQPNQSGQWTLVTTPRLESEGATNYSSQGGSSWMVMSSSKNIDVACDFLAKTFAGSVELYNRILPSSGAVATWLPAAEGDAYNQEDEFFGGQQIFKDLVSYSSGIPRVKYGVYNYEARDALQVAVADVLAGRKTVDQAVEEAENQVNFLMGY